MALSHFIANWALCKLELYFTCNKDLYYMVVYNNVVKASRLIFLINPDLGGTFHV